MRGAVQVGAFRQANELMELLVLPSSGRSLHAQANALLAKMGVW